MSNQMRLDSIDHAILHHLEQDGRLSNQELAHLVGLTPAPCLRRVRRLEEQGVIAGYHARLNPEAIGRHFCVYMLVEITMTSRKIVEEFEAAVAAFDEVSEVRRVYGAIDYIIRVDVEDGNAYERFQAEKMYPLVGVHRIVSHPTMKAVK